MSAAALPRVDPASLRKFGRGLLLPVALLVLWQVAVRYELVNVHVVAAPAAVVRRAITEYREGDLVGQILASIVRDLEGFVIGTSAGLFAGVLMGLSRHSDRALGPTFHAAKQVAVFAWLPLISVWFGPGEPAKIVFIALSAFYPVAVNAYEGVRSVPSEFLDVARVFRFSRAQVLRRVVLPSALPSIFAGVHLALVYSWLGTLGAEYLLAAGPGVGNLMTEGRESFAMDKVLLGVILAGIIGASLNAIAALLETRALRWRVRAL